MAATLDYGPQDCILEIGSERGEGSTAYLAALAAGRGVLFFSVDVDAEASRVAGQIPGVVAVRGRAEQVLAAWYPHRYPRFTWADGYDWPYSWCEGAAWCEPIREQYEQRGDQLTEQGSQESHLAIAWGLHALVRPGGVVCFDDTWLAGEAWRGKGGTAVPWLVAEGGWRVLHATRGQEPPDGYVALVRE